MQPLKFSRVTYVLKIYSIQHDVAKLKSTKLWYLKLRLLKFETMRSNCSIQSILQTWRHPDILNLNNLKNKWR